MTTHRGIVLLAVLWFLVLASIVLVATERMASEESALLWRLRQMPQQEANLQSLRLFLPALLSGQTLPPGAPHWAVRHAAAFARAGQFGRGSVTVTLGSTPVTLVIRDTAGFLAPGWQPQLLPALARTLAGRHGDIQTILQQLRARYTGLHQAGPLPARVAWRLAALTTRNPVYGGYININSVPAPVLRLLGISHARIRAFMQSRARRTTPYTSRALARITQNLGWGDDPLFGIQVSGVYRVAIRRTGPLQESVGIRTMTIRTGLATSPVPQRRPGT
ncbi:MAG TPA: hypothetical protein VMV40_00990 [Acidiferrobacter sp.]|nr:hypothetical protein [Acidiferrobacter sp.]